MVFWDSTKTLKVLAEGEYFNNGDSGQFVWPEVIKKFVDDKDSLGLTASEEGDPAVRALGALVWYLKVGVGCKSAELCKLTRIMLGWSVRHRTTVHGQVRGVLSY